ncbi:MAG: glycosyltransferase family 2 protein [Bacteroidetes bacterium]|nr:glycosyltransferase family 2 protein [Bacteroidota bacterium]
MSEAMVGKGLPRVRVVIPCRNEAGYIGRCLQSLVDADRTGVHVDVRVCDGLSDDGTVAVIDGVASKYPWIQRVDNGARTTPQALNLGLRPPGYDIGIILGAHAEVDHAFVLENVRLLNDRPDAGCVGGVIENVYTDPVSRRIGAAMGHQFGVGGAHFRTGRKEGEVDTVAFGAYRKAVFDQVGYFDDRLVRNQDDEFNYRVVQAGWRILLSPAIRSRYYVRASYRRLYRQYWQYGFWKVYVNRLHGGITTLRQLVPAIWVACLVSGAVAALLHPLLAKLYLAGIGAYLLAAVVSSIRAAKAPGDVPGVLLAFATLHFSYGLGYLLGIWKLVVLRQDPGAAHGTSSRQGTAGN